MEALNDNLVDNTFSIIEMATQNPDFFTTLIVLFIFIFMFVVVILPFFYYTTRSNQKIMSGGFESIIEEFKNHDKKDDKMFDGFIKAIEIHNEQSKNQHLELMKIVGKTKLSPSQLLEIAKSRVWITSEKKLDFISKRLEKNNLSERQDVIKKQIRTELERRSEEYIDFLNEFYDENVGLLGDWIADNFPMDEFMEEVYDVIFRTTRAKTDDEYKACRLTKINDIRFVMMSYQNTLWEDLKILLKK